MCFSPKRRIKPLMQTALKMSVRDRKKEGSAWSVCVDSRWNFSVGNFELKFLPETQSGKNFLEGELLSSADGHRESQRIIREKDKQKAEQQQKKNQQQHLDLDLVIKVSVPHWKVMAFSTGREAQLVWEHQVSIYV